MLPGVDLILLLIIFVWLIVVTFVLFKTNKHYNNLTKGITKADLRNVLEEILDREKKLNRDVDQIQKQIIKINSDVLISLKRIGIVRFNPFSDTGGSQSFTFALLDGENNGVVMTSLYTRTGNRWYIKYVKKGESCGIELSKEEKTAIQKATNIKEMKG